MGYLEALPVTRIRPVGYWPFWMGTLRDYSGYGNHGAVVGTPYWTQNGSADGINCIGAANYVSAPHNASIAITSGTLFTSGNFTRHENGVVFFRKLGVGGRYHFYLSAANIILYDGAAASSLATSIAGSKSLAVTFSPGNTPEFFIDGLSIGLGSLAVNVPVTNQALNIFGPAGVAATPAQQMESSIIYAEVLTAPEILSLHNWSQDRFTPRKQWPGGGLRYPGRETNLLDGAVWVPGGGSTVTDIDGIVTIIKDAAAQDWASTNVTDAGVQYRIQGEAESDGVVAPAVGSTAGHEWTGAVMAGWQPFDEIYIDPSGFGVYLYAVVGGGAGNYVKFRNLKVWTRPPGYTPAVGDPMFLDNIASARVTTANETTGKLGNTDFVITAGTFSLDEDAAGRYINCVVNGQLQYDLLGSDGFTTALFTATGTAALTKNPTNFQVDMLAGETFRALRLTA